MLNVVSSSATNMFAVYFLLNFIEFREYSRIIIINFEFNFFFHLFNLTLSGYYFYDSLAAGMGAGVRSMPTRSFGRGSLMLQDPKPPVTQRKHH